MKSYGMAFINQSFELLSEIIPFKQIILFGFPLYCHVKTYG